MSKHIEQEPVELPGFTAKDPTSKAYTHPAFGQIRISRVTGATTLYGSDMKHNTYVRIAINRSELQRNLSHEWHYSKEQLIEIDLSEAQFATFVSSMNIGAGVPCTIYRFNGETMPGIPFRSQTDEFENEMLEKIKRTAVLIDTAIADIEGEIGSSLSKAKREKVLNHLKTLRRDVASNMPFVAKSFDEYLEEKVEKAKVEVHAYVQNTLQHIGAQALANAAHANASLLQPGQSQASLLPPIHLYGTETVDYER